MDESVSPLFNVPISGDAMSYGGVAPTNKMGSSMTPQKYVEKDKKHTGVAGVARDVLGTLGDFLLTKLGMKPMYGPAQQNRRLSAAQANFEQDPLGAIEQVTSIDPVFGSKLRDQHIDNERLEQSALATKESAAARLEIAQQRAEMIQDEARNKALGRAASYFNGISNLAPDKRPAAYEAGRKLWGNSQSAKADPVLQQRFEEFFPEEYNEDIVTSSIGQYVPVATQWNQRLTKERIGNQVTQADRRDETTRRGQDIISGDKGASREVTKRGQDIVSGDKAKGRVTTERGQNIRAANAPEKGKVVTLPSGVKVRIK